MKEYPFGQETGDKSLYRVRNRCEGMHKAEKSGCRHGIINTIGLCLGERGSMTHTEECTVTACRTYCKKVRKGGDFFYGKSSNENYIKSL